MLIGVLALLLLLTGDPTQQTTCGACGSEGLLACQNHKRGEAELEANARHCTAAIACAQCRGTLRIDCPKCPLGDTAIERLRADQQRWLDSKQEHFKLIGDEFLVGESAHFELSWNGGAIPGVANRSAHGAMHLYLDRLEQLYEDFKAATGADDGAFSTRFRVMVWDREKHHRTAGQHYCSQPNPDTGVKRMGAVGIYSVYLDPAVVDPDENHGAELYRNILHNVSHLLLANAWNGIWPSDQNGGWIDAGVAHYFEDRFDQRCTNFCYREQNTHVDFKGGRWRAPVKKLANAKDRPPFAETANKRTTELSLEEHALAWSYCDFLITRNPQGFGALCREIKAGRGHRDALKKHFDLTPLTFEDAWREHVKTYRVR